MFDISFSELCLVLIVAAVLFSPHDILITAKNSAYYLRKIKKWYEEYSAYLYKELDLYHQKDVVRYIPDQNGIMREVYDLSSMQPNITSKKKKTENSHD